MEELLSKIGELEQKVEGLVERMEARASSASDTQAELEEAKNSADLLRQENENLKGTLSQVRERVEKLVERVEMLSGDSENSPSLF